jgi:hypothetical protein
MTKTYKIISIIFTTLASGMIILSGIFKFFPPAEMLTKLSAMGIATYLPFFGIMEIVFSILFIFPKTMKLGFILLSCYFAGAIATDLSHGNTVANAMMPLVLVWIAAFLRDRSIFMNVPSEPAKTEVTA